MNKNTHYKKVVVLLAVITLFGGASAYAEDGSNNSQGGPMGWFRGLFGGNHQQSVQVEERDNASSTFENEPRGMMGSSTRPFPQGMGMRGGMMRGGHNASSTRPMMFGRPILGTIASINGSSFTITDRVNETLTIDASNAKITTRRATPTSTPNIITVSNLTVGENVAVIGKVSTSTSSVVANQVFAGISFSQGQGENASSTEMNNGPHEGFFKKVGNLFGRIFGR